MTRTLLPWRTCLLLSILVAPVATTCDQPTESTPVPETVARIDVTAARDTIMVGEQVQVTAVPRSRSGQAMTDQPVTYSTNDKTIATVDPSGMVTGVGPGVARITAASGGATASVWISITQPALIGLSTDAIEFQAIAGPGQPDPEPGIITVDNVGSGTLARVVPATEYAARQPSGWLSVQVNGTTEPYQISLSVHTASLAVGNYQATVTVTSATAPRSETIRVTLDVGALLTISGAGDGAGRITGAGIECSISAGATSGDCEVGYRSGSTLALSATAAGASWFGGWIGCPTPGLDGCALTADRHRSVTATFNVVRDHAIQTSPYSLFEVLQQTRREDLPGQAIGITDAGGGTLTHLALGNIQYPAGQWGGWLQAELAGTMTPTTLQLHLVWDPTGGFPVLGTYYATIPVTATETGARNLTVQLDVTPSVYLGFQALPSDRHGSVTGSGALDCRPGADAFQCGRPYAPWSTVTFSGQPDPDGEFVTFGVPCNEFEKQCTITLTTDSTVAVEMPLPEAPVISNLRSTLNQAVDANCHRYSSFNMTLDYTDGTRDIPDSVAVRMQYTFRPNGPSGSFVLRWVRAGDRGKGSAQTKMCVPGVFGSNTRVDWKVWLRDITGTESDPLEVSNDKPDGANLP